MAIRVAINGFGRIGRLVLRAGYNDENLQFVAINDLADASTLAHLLKYDSVHGRLDEEVNVREGRIVLRGGEIQVFSEKEPERLPWRDLAIDCVIEATGRFTQREGAERHIRAGAKKVIVSAPATRPDVTLVLGVNEQIYDKEKHNIVSMGSCTTNCLAPIVKILHGEFGIEHGLLTTIHAYTNDQVILDFPHRDLRRARAAGLSMIPTTTGAARAMSEVIPELKGKLDGLAIRVPTPNVSLVDFVAYLSRPTTKEEVNEKFISYAEGPMKGILGYAKEPLVSCDFNHTTFSSIVDLSNTNVIGGRLVKVLSWYDNEWAFSNRIVELLKYLFR